jgi:hypothetical protein
MLISHSLMPASEKAPKKSYKQNKFKKDSKTKIRISGSWRRVLSISLTELENLASLGGGGGGGVLPCGKF